MARILIIDDNAELRTVMRRILESQGHRVSEAEDGRRGLLRLADQPVELVITDIIMPEQEGIEVILEIRKHAAGPKILAISGGSSFDAESLLSDAQALGADAVLSKPFTAAALRARVESLLAAPSAESALA